MRLWHQQLLTLIPTQQLVGQHRECCACRGAGWAKKNTVVDYVWTHPYDMLCAYHYHVIAEMDRRGYTINHIWLQPEYRGQKLGFCAVVNRKNIVDILKSRQIVYSEHDENYLKECLNNLLGKGWYIDFQNQKPAVRV